MKIKEYSSMGLTAPLSVPESVEEFNALDPKRPNAVLIEAINNVVYRGSLAEFRDTLLHGRDADPENGLEAITECVEKISGIPRKTAVVTDKDGKPVIKDGKEVTEYDEQEAKYFKRVCAEMKVEPEHFQSLATSIAAQIKFDPAKAEPKLKGPRKLPQDIVDKATSFFDAGADRIAKVFSVIQKDLKGTPAAPTLTGDKEKDIQLIGQHIKDHQNWLNKQRLEKY